ncbi:MAG: S46 family peptidase [Bacteroidales bacterium]|nr:S46 family peptidase [Bacteroidales bacterium]
MKSIKTLFLIAILFFPVSLRADEGMWIPMLLQRNEAAMQRAGMHISAADIYDVNHACLKDAVVLFGGGCTGEFVSPEGLLLTNHHCGYGQIVKHSTVEHDYLTKGFWAMDRSQELPCPGLNVVRLVRMDDVTAVILKGITDDMPESERERIVEHRIDSLSIAAVEGTHYRAVIKPFYYGNQYFIYINEVFNDVRLVGAPPSNIGKFGGDTDNWMWPRHTGDFSMFRVYMSPEGLPADYSKDNVPYKPLKHLEISLKGINEGDFTFVFGYPGTTRRYVTHDQVDLSANQENPVRIALRDIRLKHYNAAMNQSPAQRLKYASTVAGIANGWKKWQGETQGIARLRGVAMKKYQEEQFQYWADEHLRNGGADYTKVLGQLSDAYAKLRPIDIEWTYFNEGVLASDFVYRAYLMYRLAAKQSGDPETARKGADNLLRRNETYFADFEQHTIVDKAIFVETMLYVWKAGYAPYLDCKNESDVTEKLEKIYSKSILNDRAKMDKLLKKYTPKQSKKILSDPAVELFAKAYEYSYTDQKDKTFDAAQADISRYMRTYLRGMMEQYPDSNFFPDANLTLRVAYGQVKGFRPRDGVYYTHYSTLDGIMEKENPDIYDYVVEPKLRQIYAAHNYGPYGTFEGKLPVGFIATNHTTGGNSGSPVLNADGQLIGINFDRCWEGTMSDLLFDPNYCRNICLDIRYCLFLIDQFAEAKHLISEMTIVR